MYIGPARLYAWRKLIGLATDTNSPRCLSAPSAPWRSRQSLLRHGILRPLNTNASPGEKRDGSKRLFFAWCGLLTRYLAFLSKLGDQLRQRCVYYRRWDHRGTGGAGLDAHGSPATPAGKGASATCAVGVIRPVVDFAAPSDLREGQPRVSSAHNPNKAPMDIPKHPK